MMYEEFLEELERIKFQIIKLYSPFKIILFGSLAKKHIRVDSDIDICVIMDTDDKRKLVLDMQKRIVADKPYDIVVYTVDEWKNYKDNTSSFLYNILNEGFEIYGR